jgi:methylmalonyl-CoA mutase cobalamin-binding subunit
LRKQNKIDAPTEHVCSNVAREFVQAIIDEPINRTRNEQIILICAPKGKQHTLRCCVIESIILGRGCKVLNTSPSVAFDSIIRYVKNTKPDADLISVTLLENRRSAERLIHSIRAVCNIPIVIGGQAL